MTDKTPPNLSIRLDPSEREAMMRAAKADDRPVSALARKWLVERLRAEKWLGEGT